MIKIAYVLLLALLPLMAGCSSQEKNHNTLRAAIRTDPPTLDPNLATDNVSLQILIQIGEGLTQFDEKLNILPANAKSWDVTEEGTLYTFHLDPKYMWSDGTPVLARHFREAWLRLLNPRTASPYAYFLYAIQNAQEYNEGKIDDAKKVAITATDDLTLVVKLKEPLVYFPMITTFMVTYPIRTDVLQHMPDYFNKAKIILGNGPYELTEWRHDDRIVLKKNPYYGGSPRAVFDEVRISIVPEPVTELALYLRGDLDYALLTPLAVSKMAGRDDHVSLSKLRGYYYGFNQALPPFDKKKWRQAFAMALDKSKIPLILRGREKPTNAWIPPGLLGYAEKRGLAYDPEAARLLIADDVKQNNYPEIELHFNSDLVNQKLAEWAQHEWKNNLGVEVKLVNEEWASYINRLNIDPPALFRLGWGADYPDPDNFMSLFTSTSGNNHTKWQSVEYDRLIENARRMTAPSDRADAYDQAQKLLLEDDVVILPLFVQTTHYLVNPRIKKLPLSPLDFVAYKWIERR